ncbi:hypothetical protein DVR12_26555 [Chitinophaga silvatica]|uniref:RNA polymerase sigma factor 70 region 4 type 2 domain-containing protein n=1 Tax=Chitinophaga silvatica TaxID=2282649 RepID=A0A3E1Y260_9BACT|nr:sigma-70 family RNA polymerase sigma factor [Chitinophaga silvatica]RFS18762.1 hypothetical protein DVR12_26555 [Chitinophaga silvatica]
MSTSEKHNEKELLQRIAEGDEQIFARFFKEKSPLIQHWIRSLVKDETGCHEVLQDVFIQIWVYRDKLATVDNLIPWLKKVTTHQCFKHLTRWKTYYSRSGGDIAFHSDDLSSDSRVDDHLSFKEMQSIIQGVINTLTPQQKQIYQLSREDGLNSEQIASRLHLSRGHVRNTISIILALIRTHLLRTGKITFIGWLIFLK